MRNEVCNFKPSLYNLFKQKLALTSTVEEPIKNVGTHHEYQQYTFLWRTVQNYPLIIVK